MAYFEIFLQNYIFYLKYCITVKKKIHFFQKNFRARLLFQKSDIKGQTNNKKFNN